VFDLDAEVWSVAQRVTGGDSNALVISSDPGARLVVELEPGQLEVLEWTVQHGLTAMPLAEFASLYGHSVALESDRLVIAGPSTQVPLVLAATAPTTD